MNTIDGILKQFTKAIDKLQVHAVHCHKKETSNMDKVALLEGDTIELAAERRRAYDIIDKLQQLVA